MKKIILLVLSFLTFTSIVRGETIKTEERLVLQSKTEAQLVKCQSKGDAWFKIEGYTLRTHLTAIDLEDGELNNEIDEYICSKMEKGKRIELEIDNISTKMDQYNRYYVWLYIDGNLLQNDLIANGYGQVSNIEYEYLPLASLCQSQKKAIENHLGIWNYEGIKEKNCNSGIQIQNTSNKEKNKKESVKEYNKENLKSLVLLNAGVVLLAVLILQKGRI